MPTSTRTDPCNAHCHSGPPGRAPAPRPRSATRSLPLGRLFGVPVRVHWSFAFLLALVVLAGWEAGAGAVRSGLAWVGALFACVVVHELAHALLARRRGGVVVDILLLPIGGMSRMARMPSAPKDEAAVAAVGPAASIVLGAAFLVVGAAAGSAVWPPTLLAGSWWARLGWLNLLLGVFNLLPALPMDGGRMLRAGLARRRSRLRATRVAVRVAHLVAAALVVAGAFFDLWLAVIGIFVYVGASSELAQARAEDARARWAPPPGWGPPLWPPAVGRRPDVSDPPPGDAPRPPSSADPGGESRAS